MENKPIGVFDSGVGGFSILTELEKLLPNESFIFLGDQKNVPYGGKTKEQLLKYLGRAMDFFLSKNTKAAVFACNTATVYTIDEMREKYDIPIIGTVPVVKQLKKHSKTNRAAVFSTPATAKSKYLKDLVDKFCSGVEVKLVGGSNLEDLVEKGNLENHKIEDKLKSILKPLIESGVDTIALGCTHYPFLKDKIQKIVGEKVKVLDSGRAVARRTKEVLDNEDLLADKKYDENYYYTTGDKSEFKRVAEELLGKKLERVEKLSYA